MLVVFMQALLILGLIFAIGLMIGHIFGVMIHRAFDKLPAQKILTEETLFDFQGGFELSPKAVMSELAFTNEVGNETEIEPEQLDLILRPEIVTETVPSHPSPEPLPILQGAPEADIHYPIWSFGVITETHNRNRFSHEAQLSPLAHLSRSELELRLSAVQRPVEPIRFETPPRGHRDDLTRLRGLELPHQDALNRLGIYHLWQMASWDAPQTVWIASRIAFPELILTHHWIEQAAIELGCLRDESPNETLSWLKLDSLTPA